MRSATWRERARGTRWVQTGAPHGGTSTPSSSAGSATLVLYTSAAILYNANSLMVLMLLEMKSVTGVILAGSAHPTHVTPVTGKARS